MEQSFLKIITQMQQEYPEVSAGKMMRSPAIKYRSKVFAFFHENEMIFKLDATAAEALDRYPGSRFLNPFKNKPPMKGWLVVPGTYKKDWKHLAIAAYRNISN